jgi:hypothetical protein
MTAAELCRALAVEIERREELEKVCEQLRAELQRVKAEAAEIKPQEWLSTKEACEFLGVSLSFITKDRMLKIPKIPFRKDGHRTLYYSRTDLVNFINTHMSDRQQKKTVLFKNKV